MHTNKLFILLGAVLLASQVFADVIPLEGASQSQQPQQVQQLPQPEAVQQQAQTPAQFIQKQKQKQQQPQQQSVQPATPKTAPPVEQLPQNGLAPTSGANLNLQQKITQLEEQIQNYTQMNLPQKISNLQQQVLQLQTQVGTLSHEVQVLKQQPQTVTKPKAPAPAAAPASKPNIFSVPSSAKPSAANDKDSYNKAFSLLMAKKYQPAASKMQEYLNQYPKGQYAVNAHYWLGEIYYLQSQFSQANVEFQAVVKDYPNSSKIPDSKYKIAMINLIQNNSKVAQQELQQLVQNHPNSSAAALARQQLQSVH